MLHNPQREKSHYYPPTVAHEMCAPEMINFFLIAKQCRKMNKKTVGSSKEKNEKREGISGPGHKIVTQRKKRLLEMKHLNGGWSGAEDNAGKLFNLGAIGGPGCQQADDSPLLIVLFPDVEGKALLQGLD